MTGRFRQCLFAVVLLGWICSSSFAESFSKVEMADPHQQLQEILKRPLYQRWQLRQGQAQDSAAGAAAREELQKFADWLDEWIRFLFRSPRSATGSWAMPSLSDGLKILFWIVGGVAIGLFVLALVILLIRVFRDNQKSRSSDNVLSREQIARALDQGNALAMGGEQWLDEAGRLAAEKNFRAMYRAMYLALLSGLHANGTIDFNRHHTNWTYVHRYRGLPAEREVFSSLTDLFDSVWYGWQTSSHADLNTLRSQVQTLIQSSAPAGRDARAT